MRISDWSSDVCSSDLLPPPPLSAQSRSGFSSSLARTSTPSAVTTSAAIRLSTESPCLARSHPIPPDRVKPATPVSEMRPRSEEPTSELQSLMRISYAVLCLQNKTVNYTPSSNDYNYSNNTPAP